jgi:hypothetical protein
MNWSYIGTFDNDATTTELRFLAKVILANGKEKAAWRAESIRLRLAAIASYG